MQRGLPGVASATGIGFLFLDFESKIGWTPCRENLRLTWVGWDSFSGVFVGGEGQKSLSLDNKALTDLTRIY